MENNINTAVDPILLKKACPIFAIVNIEQIPVNPYREFSYYASHVIYDKLPKKSNMTFTDFHNMTNEERENVLNDMFSDLPDVRVEFTSPSHKRIFLSAEIYSKDVKVCTLIFYTHLAYTANGTSDPNHEFVSVEVDFTHSDDLEFTGTNKSDNVFDFSKDGVDKNPLSMDILAAHLRGLCDFTEYIRYLKTKMLTTKNIRLFADKFVRPYVADMSVLFAPTEFIIGVICGEEIIKQNYTYDNYLDSVKAFGKAITDKYGDKYKVENEEKETASDD